jgi:hypothetical protein
MIDPFTRIFVSGIPCRFGKSPVPIVAWTVGVIEGLDPTVASV